MSIREFAGYHDTRSDRTLLRTSMELWSQAARVAGKGGSAASLDCMFSVFVRGQIQWDAQIELRTCCDQGAAGRLKSSGGSVPGTKQVART